MKTTIFLTVIGLCNLVLGDYNNPSTNKEAAIKASGAYRQEFERRMSGQTGFENAAKGIQELSQMLSGPALPSTPNHGKSIEEHMAELVMKSLNQGATLEGIGIKNDAIIDAIDADIKKNKKVDDSTVFLNDVAKAYEWKAELLLGIRDPGVVERDLKAGYKAYDNALDYRQKSLDLDNDKYKEDDHPEKIEKYSWQILRLRFTLARMKLAGIGTSKDVSGAVKEFTEIANSDIKYDDYSVYQSYCTLIPTYAYGSENFEKNIDKVVEYAQRAAELSLKNKADRVDNWNRHAVCKDAQNFIQPVVADIKSKKAATNLASVKNIKDCSDCPEVIAVPAGAFSMGLAGDKYQGPSHKVTFEKSFAVGKTEVTRGQFAAFVKATKFQPGKDCDAWKQVKGRSWQNLTYKQTDVHPVVCVTWAGAKAYTEWLSKKTKQKYRLPSEAEWEYACNATDSTKYCGGDNLDEVAWYDGNSKEATHPVAQKKANAWGLFDMTGNVSEWVLDSHHKDGYIGAPTDGTEWVSSAIPYKMARGGSLFSEACCLTTTYRNGGDSNNQQEGYSSQGFRVVRELQQ